jgi:hypothetical protein
MRRFVHWVCPRNGERIECPVDQAPFPHRREELLPEGRKAPACDTHRVRLVRA